MVCRYVNVQVMSHFSWVWLTILSIIMEAWSDVIFAVNQVQTQVHEFVFAYIAFYDVFMEREGASLLFVEAWFIYGLNSVTSLRSVCIFLFI